jgi:hypothetical protein
MRELQQALADLRDDLALMAKGWEEGERFSLDTRDLSIRVKVNDGCPGENNDAAILLIRIVNGSGTMADVRHRYISSTNRAAFDNDRASLVSQLQGLAGRIMVDNGGYSLRPTYGHPGTLTEKTGFVRSHYFVAICVITLVIGLCVTYLYLKR